MIGFDLLRPELAWLLLAAPLALAVGWRGLVRARAELALWVVERHQARFLPGAARGRATARLCVAALAVLLLALAALGPVRGYTYRSVSRRGLDLVLCLDTSRSMLAQDLRPSRLERAKREVVGLLDHLRGDRVALVAFSGDARDVAPLTRDRQTLERLLAFVTPEDNHEGGTNLAAAIDHALELFDGRTGAHEAVVLLTDGEDLEGEAAARADEASRRGIRIFVVGVGTEAGGKIPIVEGGVSSFLRDENGQEVVTRLERESLVALAEKTGGDFLSAEESPTALEDLYRARVSRIQGREIEGGERRVPYDRFQWPLALALACLVAEPVLRARARRTGGSARLAATLFLSLAGPASQEPAQPLADLASAVFHHRAGEPAEAEAAARAVLAQADALGLPEDLRARAHFALGVVRAARALEGGEESAAARAEAEEALATARALAGPGPLRRDAVFDLGTLALVHAEDVRATIPEISGQPAGGPGASLAPSGLPPGPGTPGGAPPADPLKEARTLYRKARTWLVERLRLEWQDEDTRADLELIQRRLHELDEIEKQREEQKDQQKQDDQDQNQDQKDQQDQDQSQDQKDQQQKDQQQEGQDGEGDPNPQDPQQKDEKPKDPEDSKDQQDQPQETPPEDEAQPQEPEEGGQDQAQPPPRPQPSEQVLTREEVMQLLDKLADLEKKQKALEAALHARRRAQAKRDW